MHIFLLTELYKLLLENKKDVEIFNKHSHEELCRIIFKNYYRGQGLELSSIGFELFNSCFTSYTLEFPKKFEVKPKYKIFFDDNMRYPYRFESKNKMICFDEEFVVRLKFYNDDIEMMIKLLTVN